MIARRPVRVIGLMALLCLLTGCTLQSRLPDFKGSQYGLVMSSGPFVGTGIIQLAVGRGGTPADRRSVEERVQEEVDRLLGLEPRSAVPSRLVIYEIPGCGPSEIESPLAWIELRQNASRHMKDALQTTGVFGEVDYLPELLLPGGSARDLMTLRLAAARAQADGLLVYSTETGFEHKLNGWSVFYLTLIGVGIAPGSELTSLATSKAALIDVGTGYIHFVTEAHGQRTITGAVADLDAEDLEAGVRMQALTALSEELVRRVTKLEATQ